MVVRDDDGIHNGNVFDLARRLGEPLGSKPLCRRAPVRHHRVKQDSKARGELNQPTGVPKPCRSQVIRICPEALCCKGRGSNWHLGSRVSGMRQRARTRYIHGPRR